MIGFWDFQLTGATPLLLSFVVRPNGRCDQASMFHRTAVLSSFDAYLASEHLGVAIRPADFECRNETLLRFPYAVMLELSFAELDYANRWCWQRFGSPHGECIDTQSEYPTCNILSSHCHPGTWANEWYAKTEYNHGFNEWYFSASSQYEQFLAFVPQINWGEHFPK
jgi:hypothetical protein